MSEEKTTAGQPMESSESVNQQKPVKEITDDQKRAESGEPRRRERSSERRPSQSFPSRYAAGPIMSQRSYMDRNAQGDKGGDFGRGDRFAKPRFIGKMPYRKRIDKIRAHNLYINYKHADVLRRFITDKGKILPRRVTGNSAKNQRRLIREIKRARFLALLPMG